MSKSDADLLNRVRSEIDARLQELRPHLEEYEQLQSAAAALGIADHRTPPARAPAPPPRRRSRRRASVRVPGAATQKRILDALEHGSHTVGELVVVTALSGPSVRQHLRRLLGSEAVTRAKRDGKAAYTLASRARP